MNGTPDFFKRKGAPAGVFTRIERKRLSGLTAHLVRAYIGTVTHYISNSTNNANACRRLLGMDR